jgi:class 3 adenylate cyclase/tetratricopeptide (TPR) repeat protein
MPDREELKAAIAGLEAQRARLGESVVEPALAALRRQLLELEGSTTQTRGDEERKNVTILFVDVSGFTALAETLDPEEVRELVNACFECLVPIVEKYEGTIDKFIGDEVMALFGAPVAHENDPERALRTALEMMDAIVSFNRQHKTNLGLHIGINTGRVVTGAIGSQDRRDYSVMGDAVNLAARLEDASSDGEIFVGATTHRLTTALFDFESVPPLTLKGKSNPVEVYRLIRLKSVPKSFRGIEGLRAELVGRDREVETMKTAIQRLRDGGGGVMAIAGEAGVGKSRLVSEVLNCFAPNLIRAEGRALSHTSGMSYWMARDLLRNLMGIRPEMDPVQSNSILRGEIEKVIPADGANVYPYLGRLLEVALPPETDEQLRFLTNEALHGRILRAFRDYVATRARREPLILFWEDLHWCDPSSFLILEMLLPLPVEGPLLLLLAYRPDDETILQWQKKTGFPSGIHCQTIQLPPLNREQSRLLIRSLLRLESLPEKIREVILDRAEGNPFFVEELLRSLIESGAIRIGADGKAITSKFESVDVPDTVEGVLMGRVDRLSPRNKQVLQHAAILGRVFSEKLLCRLLEGQSTAAGPGEALSELQARDFIHLRPTNQGGEAEYSFKHAITHEVVYDSLLISRRKELHRQAGTTLEALFPDRRDEFAATLGYHFKKGQAHEKAVHYLTQAGDRAQAAFANPEAIDFYQAAISEIDALQNQTNERDEDVFATSAHLHEKLGDVLELVGRHDGARETYQLGFKFLPGTDRVSRSRLYRKLGFSFSVHRRFEEAAGAFDKAETELGPETDQAGTIWWNEKIEVLIERLHLLYWLGLADEMTSLAQEQRAVVERQGRPIQRGMFFMILSLTELTRGRYVPSEPALSFARLAVDGSKGATELQNLVRIEFVLGFVQIWCGHLPEAIVQIGRALAIAEKIGDVVTQARCLIYIAVAYRRLHDVEQAHRVSMLALKLAQEVEMPEYISMANANLAWVAWKNGNREQARTLGTDALERWHGMSDPYGFDWMALLPVIAADSEDNRVEEAIVHVRELFGPNQHPLPPALTQAAQRVIDSEKEDSSVLRVQKLNRLIEVSKEIGYL